MVLMLGTGQHMVTQQAFEPLVDPDYLKTSGSDIFVDPARFNKRAGSKMIEPLVFFQKSWLTSGAKACWVTICWSPEINILDPVALAFRHA